MSRIKNKARGKAGTLHSSSENRREFNLHELEQIAKSERQRLRGIQRKRDRQRRWYGYMAHGDSANGKAAARRRRQIAAGSLRAENGLEV